MSCRQFADSVFEPGHGLVGDAPAVTDFVLEGKPKKRSFPRPRNRTLPLVDLKLEMAFNETGQAYLSVVSAARISGSVQIGRPWGALTDEPQQLRRQNSRVLLGPRFTFL